MEVIIFIGLQGSGKTTFFQSLFTATHEHISKDNFPNVSRRDRRQLRMLQEALRQGRSVVVDNTNATITARAPLIELAQSFDATVSGYYFQSRLKDCVARNARREGKARVPDVAIYTTAARLELPTLGEGFNGLFYVSLKEDGSFNISEWQNESAIEPKE